MTRRQEEFKEKVRKMTIPELTIRNIQLEERHRVIMEAWEEKSVHKTNLKLKAMYNELWDELTYIRERLYDIYKVK